MKRLMFGMCMAAVVLWAGTGAGAQGQGKGSGKGDQERTKERAKEQVKEQVKGQALPPTKVQEKEPAVDSAEKKAGKGKAAKQGEDTGAEAGESKQQEPKGKKAEKAAAKAEEKGKGKGREQQALALQKQLQHEQAKHLERQARLNRIRELAVQKGDTETVARVDKLIAKENEVYGRKLEQIQGQPRVTPPAGPQSTAPATVGPNEVRPVPGPNDASVQKLDAGEVTKEEAKEPMKTNAKQGKGKKK